MCHLDCDKDYFKCSNGFCLPLTKTCDGRDDCSDGSDEKIPCGLWMCGASLSESVRERAFKISLYISQIKLQHSLQMDCETLHVSSTRIIFAGTTRQVITHFTGH